MGAPHHITQRGNNRQDVFFAVVVPERADSMAKGFGRAHNSYSRYLNSVRGRSGHLWQNRFYSAPLGPAHLVRALRYVDLNPLRAGLVESPLDYPWSSARAHVRGADPAGLLDLELWAEVCPLGDWEGALQQRAVLEDSWMEQIRRATHSGKPLGNRDFVRELESRKGVDLEIRGRGRPPKKELGTAAIAAAQSS